MKGQILGLLKVTWGCTTPCKYMWSGAAGAATIWRGKKLIWCDHLKNDLLRQFANKSDPLQQFAKKEEESSSATKKCGSREFKKYKNARGHWQLHLLGLGLIGLGTSSSAIPLKLSAQCALFCLVSNNCKQFVNYWIEACLCTRIFCPISQNVNICNSAVFSTQGFKFKKSIFLQLCTFSNSGMGVEKYTDTATFKRS